MTAENRQDNMGHLLWATVRRLFRRCQGRPVNNLSRQLTPEEAVDFQEEMAERERREMRKGSSVNEVPEKTGV